MAGERPVSWPSPLRGATAGAALALALASCGGERARSITEITFSGSAVGREGELLRRQIARFEAANPDVRVDIRVTPDDATQRHQLFVQWLNARLSDPDVLQLDVIWTAEFAAAGWIAPLDVHAPDTGAFFAAAIRAARFDGRLYAIPWFVDVGMLYRRIDLVARAPDTMDELVSAARAATRGSGAPAHGIVWQGARYEGLVTVFLEYLTAFGGRVLDDAGRVIVDTQEGVRALEFMSDQIGDVAPRDVLTWHEEETRFAFQNGNAAFMRNWPYAYALLDDSTQSRVRGRYAVSAMPGAPGGRRAAALGGAELAVNANSDSQEEAYRLIAWLTHPDRMLERARDNGQFPARAALFDEDELREALRIPVDEAREVIEHAVERPVTPLYAQVSDILQIHLHRALAGQAAAAASLSAAAREMNRVLERSGVAVTPGGR